MATIEGYSVAKTAFGGSDSDVYSLTPLGGDGGGSQAYLHSTVAGMMKAVLKLY